MMILQQILKNMLSNRTRLILTILAIAWGTFSITSMLAVGEGLRVTFGNAVDQSGDGALIVAGNKSSRTYKGTPSGTKVEFRQQDIDNLQESMKGKATISAVYDWNVSIFRGAKARHGAPVIAIDENYAKLHGVKVKPGGRFINYQDDKNHRQVIVLGTRTLKKLFKRGENPIGKYVYLGNQPFTVIGVQKETMQLLSTSSSPDYFVNWIPYHTYQELTKDLSYTQVIVAPNELSDIPIFEKEIINNIALSRQVDPEDPSIFEIINLQKEKEKLNVFFSSIEIVLGIIGALTLVVAGVGIANVMAISVKRSTREIGIRMAVGAKTSDILIYYALEALITTAIGGLIGIFMAKGLVGVINLIPINSEIMDKIGSPKPILSFNVMFFVIFILGLVGFVSGIFPARKAASIQPAEALRHEQ